MAEANFGRYRVTGTLGAGGMGEVYAAIDDVLGRQVAVKTLRGKHSGLAARMLDERFRQEARAIAQLSHPGIVQVFDIDLAPQNGPPYIVMERMAGPSLKDRLGGDAKPLGATELAALGIQIARALAAAHAQGIVHRDVKPANILAATDGMWKLADFGVAHVPDSSLTMTGQFVGSPAYAPPEALVRGQSGPAGDVFGLGASLYEAALGRWPRAEASQGALLAPVQPLRELAPHLPESLAAAIDRAVAIEPDARPTAAQLADALAGTSAVSLPAPPAPKPRAGFLAKPWQRYAIAGAGVVLVVGIIAALAGGKSKPRPDEAASPPPVAKPEDEPPPQDDRPHGPRSIHATPPKGMDGKQARDWEKIVSKLYEHHWAEARKRLADFERKYGETDETKSLAEQLDNLDVPERD